MNNSHHIDGSGTAISMACSSIPGVRHQRTDLKKTLAQIVEHLLRALFLVFSLCKTMATTNSPGRQGQMMHSQENGGRGHQSGEGSINGEEDLLPTVIEGGYPALPCDTEERCVLLLYCAHATVRLNLPFLSRTRCMYTSIQVPVLAGSIRARHQNSECVCSWHSICVSVAVWLVVHKVNPEMAAFVRIVYVTQVVRPSAQPRGRAVPAWRERVARIQSDQSHVTSVVEVKK